MNSVEFVERLIMHPTDDAPPHDHGDRDTPPLATAPLPVLGALPEPAPAAVPEPVPAERAIPDPAPAAVPALPEPVPAAVTWITVRKVVVDGSTGAAQFVDTDDNAVPVPPVFWARVGSRTRGPPAAGQAAGYDQPSLMKSAPCDTDGAPCWLVGNMAAYGTSGSRRTYLTAIAPTAVLAPAGVSRVAVSSLVRVCLGAPLPCAEAVALVRTTVPPARQPKQRPFQDVDEDEPSASDGADSQRRTKRRTTATPPQPAPAPAVPPKPRAQPVVPATTPTPKPAAATVAKPASAAASPPKPAATVLPSDMVLARLVGWAEGRGIEFPSFVQAWTTRAFPSAAPPRGQAQEKAPPPLPA